CERVMTAASARGREPRGPGTACRNDGERQRGQSPSATTPPQSGASPGHVRLNSRGRRRAEWCVSQVGEAVDHVHVSHGCSLLERSVPVGGWWRRTRPGGLVRRLV